MIATIPDKLCCLVGEGIGGTCKGLLKHPACNFNVDDNPAEGIGDGLSAGGYGYDGTVAPDTVTGIVKGHIHPENGDIFMEDSASLLHKGASRVLAVPSCFFLLIRCC